ncbi:MAG: DUF6599 family protein [Terracidiphilus sp.]|jgi:hypothetical protein
MGYAEGGRVPIAAGSTVYPEDRSQLMRWMHILACFLTCSGALLGAAASAQSQAAPAKPAEPAKAAAKAVPPPAPTALLPDSFAGWVATEPLRTVTDPAQADAANAAALKEYDFTDAATASYKRSGETLSLRALRFHDASGAYGAYSFYRQNGWPKEEIGSGATSNHNRVLFWLGNTVVDANFSHIGPMSGSELRELASHLPVPGGNKAIAPPILSDLPKDSLDGQTTHYALGPASYAGAGGVLPPDLVGFDRGAEAVTANYTLRSNAATLTLVNYPTPQMAAAQESKIRAYIKAGSQAQPPWPKPLRDSDQASLEVRRSGPLLALVSGDAIPEESHKLLATVHYDADLTTIPAPPGDSDVAKTAKLLVGIAALVIIGASAAILLGFFLGGGRALYRMARGKPVSSVYEEEFIHLDLREEWVESVPAIDSPHPKG